MEYIEYRKLWVACIIEQNGSLLLARRLKRMDNGILGPPGGSVESGESLISAAERECLEETGCLLRGPRVIGFSDVDSRGLVAFVSGHLDNEPQCTEPMKQKPWIWIRKEERILAVQLGIRDYWSDTYIKVKTLT